MSKHLDFAVSLAKKAGPIIKRNFSLGMSKKWKHKTSPVTETDIQINNMVQSAVKKAYPSHGFVGEEGGEDYGPEYVWICDPVDGTLPFSNGIPTCVFMIALLRHGRPILSVVYDPFQDRMFTAEKDKGAKLNGNKIHVSKHNKLEGAVFSLIWWAATPYNLIPVIEHLNRVDAMDASVGSVGYVNMLLACGQFSIVAFAGTKVWDSAPLDILVTEAGGKFTDLYGEVIDYRNKNTRGHLATNGILHAKMLALLKEKMR